ncbi:MAG: hypothetical protein RBR06_08215 [Desulfuromonadaceae bacterium]|nr:hypothetical protein [Desulfuromonadaceae bacterium]
MKRLVFGFLWLGIFILLLVVVDQVFLHYRGFKQPFVRDIQKFHADFRQRLFGLPQVQPPAEAPPQHEQSTPAVVDKKAASMDALVEREIAREVLKKGTQAKTAPAEDAVLRYIYIDAQQNIQFAQRLEEIPASLRASARPVTQ